jgi:hypothetical protein
LPPFRVKKCPGGPEMEIFKEFKKNACIILLIYVIIWVEFKRGSLSSKDLGFFLSRIFFLS